MVECGSEMTGCRSKVRVVGPGSGLLRIGELDARYVSVYIFCLCGNLTNMGLGSLSSVHEYDLPGAIRIFTRPVVTADDDTVE